MTEHSVKGHFDASRAQWRHAEGSAVQIAVVGDLIGMRNADQPDGPVLIFTPAEWEAFVLGAEDGEFDPDTFDTD